MKKELKVVFRKFDNGEIIAMFPQFGNKRNWRIDSYCINDWLSKIVADLTTLYGRDN